MPNLMPTTNSWHSTPLTLTKVFTPPQPPKSFYGAIRTAAPNFPAASIIFLSICFASSF